MKTTMIAALVAAQLSTAASPAQAAERPRDEAGAQQVRIEERAELNLADGQPDAAPLRAAAEDGEGRKKKRKSTGDKVLTGAAVVLGIGALAVGGLLVAIFVG